MIRIGVLGFNNVLGSSMTGISDLLSLARLQRSDPQSPFQVQIASCDGEPVTALNGIRIAAHCSIDDLEPSDVFLVPAIAEHLEATLNANHLIIKKLESVRDSANLIVSNSSGAFFLAEAGLLDGKIATTHPGTAERFRSKYPQVNLREEQRITHDGNILCDGGGLSWFDLGLYLIELFCNHETAVRAAKTFVLDSGRPNQLSYSPLIGKKFHNDERVLSIQNWMEARFREAISMEQLGDQVGLSNRSLIRRFKLATGMTPSAYLQEVRIDSARRLLVQSDKRVDEITRLVGYEDFSSFSKLFKRKNGMTPSEYRARLRPV